MHARMDRHGVPLDAFLPARLSQWAVCIHGMVIVVMSGLGPTERLLDGWVDGWMDGWMDGL